jgi:hypothetical protein
MVKDLGISRWLMIKTTRKRYGLDAHVDQPRDGPGHHWCERCREQDVRLMQPDRDLSCLNPDLPDHNIRVLSEKGTQRDA